MGGNEFALAMQCGYKQGYEDGAIAELKKLKKEINLEEIDCQYETDWVYNSGLEKVIELIDNRIEELKEN